MVMRDLAVDVMEDMSLGNPVSSRSTNPAHDRTKIAKEVAVESSKGTTGEGKF